jgi:predicted acyl esterase
LFLVILVSGTLASVVAAADAKPSVAPGAKEEMVAMRDGVCLATNIFLPKGEGPWPVVLTRTPYSKDGMFGSLAGRYTGAGYAFVIQDCRGRFRSEGEYRTFEDDLNDGFDTVEWIAKQNWCNSRVGMSGASAMGITSLLAAIARPPALKACYVVVAPESFWTEASWIGGVFKEADTTGWMESQGVAHEVPRRKKSLLDTAEEEARDIARNRHLIQIPIYHVGGWYDIFSTGTQGNFVFLHNHGADGARGRQKLLMGPFGHGGLTGDLKYKGDVGLLGAISDDIRWFDYHLKDLPNGIADEPPVKYYQMAAARKKEFSDKNGWRTAENWPPASRETRYFLNGDRRLTTTAPTEGSAATTYAHDPANPVPTVGGANLTLPLGPKDQREIAERPDYLRFQTEPLTDDVSIAGTVWVELFASTDGPDTDFMVKLVDVYPDGYEALLLDAPLRAMFRHGRRFDQIKPMEPGKPEKLRIDLGSTAQTFEKGHRIAVHVSSSNHPRFEVNPNTGELPGEATSTPRVAQNTIHHDVEHPTALVLPVVE